MSDDDDDDDTVSSMSMMSLMSTHTSSDRNSEQMERIALAEAERAERDPQYAAQKTRRDARRTRNEERRERNAARRERHAARMEAERAEQEAELARLEAAKARLDAERARYEALPTEPPFPLKRFEKPEEKEREWTLERAKVQQQLETGANEHTGITILYELDHSGFGREQYPNPRKGHFLTVVDYCMAVYPFWTPNGQAYAVQYVVDEYSRFTKSMDYYGRRGEHDSILREITEKYKKFLILIANPKNRPRQPDGHNDNNSSSSTAAATGSPPPGKGQKKNEGGGGEEERKETVSKQV